MTLYFSTAKLLIFILVRKERPVKTFNFDLRVNKLLIGFSVFDIVVVAIFFKVLMLFVGFLCVNVCLSVASLLPFSCKLSNNQRNTSEHRFHRSSREVFNEPVRNAVAHSFFVVYRMSTHRCISIRNIYSNRFLSKTIYWCRNRRKNRVSWTNGRCSVVIILFRISSFCSSH